MKFEHAIRQALLDNSIRIVAEGGFECATTRAITYGGEVIDGVSMNDANIYRIFGGKDGLFDSAFELIEERFAELVCDSLDDGENIRKVVKTLLEFWTDNPLWCRYYIRYCYSQRLSGKAREKHDEALDRIAGHAEDYFAPDTPVRLIIHILLTAILDMAFQSITGKAIANKKAAVDALTGIVKPYLR